MMGDDGLMMVGDHLNKSPALLMTHDMFALNQFALGCCWNAGGY